MLLSTVLVTLWCIIIINIGSERSLFPQVIKKVLTMKGKLGRVERICVHLRHEVAWVGINWAGRSEKQEQREECTTVCVWMWWWVEEIVSLLSCNALSGAVLLAVSWNQNEARNTVFIGRVRKDVIASLYPCIKILS